MTECRLLLSVDAVVNLLLGVLLLFFPARLVEMIGIPASEHSFYPSILGAVLFGIGLALLIQNKSHGGLGLIGAVAINLCGGIVLAIWLVFGSLALPTRGLALLWTLVVILVCLSAIELFVNGKRHAA